MWDFARNGKKNEHQQIRLCGVISIAVLVISKVSVQAIYDQVICHKKKVK